jgi:hypothetical protein
MGNSFWVLMEKFLLCKLNKEIENTIYRYVFYMKISAYLFGDLELTLSGQLSFQSVSDPVLLSRLYK